MLPQPESANSLQTWMMTLMKLTLILLRPSAKSYDFPPLDKTLLPPKPFHPKLHPQHQLPRLSTQATTTTFCPRTLLLQSNIKMQLQPNLLPPLRRITPQLVRTMLPAMTKRPPAIQKTFKLVTKLPPKTLLRNKMSWPLSTRLKSSPSWLLAKPMRRTFLPFHAEIHPDAFPGKIHNLTRCTLAKPFLSTDRKSVV